MRKDYQLFGLGMQGKSPNVSSTHLLNAYYEFQKFPDTTQIAIYGTPGLSQMTDAGSSPWRGLHSMPSTSLIYGVNGSTFYAVNNAGVLTSRGTISTSSGRVDITDDGTRVSVVDGQELYYYDTTTPTTNIAAAADADRPTAPNTCCFQGGRILTDENGTGKFKGSGAYATTWDALHFATAESKPDPLVRVAEYSGVVILFGEFSAEPWQLVGGAGFPYARVMGEAWEWGLAARWSLAKFIGGLAFLSKNREGQVQVSVLDKSGARRISNFELEHLINGYSTTSDASGFGYMLGGHPMYQLNFPTANKSWLYDGSTDYWSELKSSGDRHRGNLAVNFLDQTIVADYENGKLYRLKEDIYTDNGTPITVQLTGKHLEMDGYTFSADWIELQGETGTVAQGVDPYISLQISKDGGHTFGTEQYRAWGKSGEYRKRAVWRGQGIGTDMVPRFTISANTKKAFTTEVVELTKGVS